MHPLPNLPEAVPGGDLLDCMAVKVQKTLDERQCIIKILFSCDLRFEFCAAGEPLILGAES